MELKESKAVEVELKECFVKKESFVKTHTQDTFQKSSTVTHDEFRKHMLQGTKSVQATSDVVNLTNLHPNLSRVISPRQSSSSTSLQSMTKKLSPTQLRLREIAGSDKNFDVEVDSSVIHFQSKPSAESEPGESGKAHSRSSLVRRMSSKTLSRLDKSNSEDSQTKSTGNVETLKTETAVEGKDIMTHEDNTQKARSMETKDRMSSLGWVRIFRFCCYTVYPILLCCCVLNPMN